MKDLHEVWVAYEPMLDLVKSEGGAYHLLNRQLKDVQKIQYFQSNKIYFSDLYKILQNDGIGEDKLLKLKYIKIDSPYSVPVVLYHTKNGVLGVIGKFHPKLEKQKNGFYILEQKLPPDWMYYINEKYVNMHIEILSKYLKKENH